MYDSTESICGPWTTTNLELFFIDHQRYPSNPIAFCHVPCHNTTQYVGYHNNKKKSNKSNRIVLSMRGSLSIGAVLDGGVPRQQWKHRVHTRVTTERHVWSMITCQAGFGKSSSDKKMGKKGPKLAKYLDVKQPPSTSSLSESDGWFQVPDISVKDTFVSKPIKAVILESGRAICLFKVNSTIYCTDANSTAFKYPLADASIIQLQNGNAAVEVKLDGTVYDLATGRVVSWCPKNNPIRSVLGSLKDKSEPEDLPVYPVDIRGDNVWVNLSTPL